jgi:TPR repeat protein
VRPPSGIDGPPELGYPSAQNALGRLYEDGQGVPRNLEEAKAWWQLAARQGHPDATAALRRLDKAQ